MKDVPQVSSTYAFERVKIDSYYLFFIQFSVVYKEKTFYTTVFNA